MASEHENEEDELEDEGAAEYSITQILPVELAEELRAGGEEDTPELGYDESCTYQLEPAGIVQPKEIVEIAERILNEQFADQEYSETDMKDIVMKASSDIRESVRALGLDRYRIVCQVTVGEKCNQDVAMTFLCLWKHECDHYAVATYDGSNFFATALVFVLYKQ